MRSKHGFDTTDERSRLMRAIKGRNTKPEIALRKALWNFGLRYRINVTSLPGKPDIVIGKHKIIIFIDGEFWHGYKWVEKKERIKANRSYWIPKIERNMERDIKNNALLNGLGWKVIRFWEHEVKRNIEECLRKVAALINTPQIKG